MHHIHLNLSSRLTEQGWDTLLDFGEKCERLIATRLVAEGGHMRATVNWNVKDGLFFRAELPAEEQVVQFLAAFRFFYLQKEPTNFLHILSMFGKYADDQSARDGLRVIRRRWRDALFRNALKIAVNKEPITAERLLDAWFNAHYFHSDKVKKADLDLMNEVFSADYSKYMLLDAVYEAVKLIFKVYDSLRPLLEQRRAALT